MLLGTARKRLHRRYRIARRFVLREYNYAKYRLGRYPTVFNFTGRPDAGAVTVLVPNSSGDVAMNSSVTSYLKASFPDVRITLITHPWYVDVGHLNPDYHEVVGYGPPYSDIPPWKLPYRSQVDIARELTPDMDRLFLSQPNSWCPGFVDRFSLLEMQQVLCGVPEAMREHPRLRVPDDIRARVSTFRQKHSGPSFFLAPKATTIRLGAGGEDYWRGLARKLVGNGAQVFFNSEEAPLEDPGCIAVGSWPLIDAVALAVDCDAVVSTRSGFSDIVGFCSPGMAHRILFPSGRNLISRLTWLEWCSVRDMGVPGAVECFTEFDSDEGVVQEIDRTVAWLDQKATRNPAGQ